MLNILKNFKSVDKPLTESTITECGGMSAAPSTPVTVNLSAGSAGEMAAILKALSNIDSGTSMPMPAPTDMGMSKLKSIVSNSSMDADAAYSDVINDEEDLDEGMDPKAVMGQIRKMAKGVETSHDEREHRIFASQVESDLIDLFQYYNQVQRDTEKQEIVRNLIRQNKKAQQQTDLRNANNIVSVLWDLMNANEEFVNEPDEEYQDHQYMTKALSGGINRQKQMYAKSQDGDNAMAVESIKDKLIKALSEKKQIDRNGDGKNDWEDVKLARKAAAAKAAKKKGPVKEAEFKAPTHELDDTARKAMNIAQIIKRKINSGEQMDDRDYNQMAELGAVLSRFGTSFGPKTMKDVMAHMVQYTDDRNQEGHGYPEFNVERFKELLAMAR